MYITEVIPWLSAEALRYECLLYNCFTTTAKSVGFHSWVTSKDAFLVTLRMTASPSEVERKEEAVPQVPERESICLWGWSSKWWFVPNISKSSYKVRTRFPWKQWGTMRGLIIHHRLKRPPWASWRSNHHLFQVLNNESTSKLLNYKPVIIWGLLVYN